MASNGYNETLNLLYNFDQERITTITPPNTTPNWGYGYGIRDGLKPIKLDDYEIVMEGGDFVFKKKQKKKFYIDI